MLRRMVNALTIAGSDSVGGAGLQADLKAFEALGVHGCAVVTCVTSQNTKGVSSIHAIPEAEVAAQLRSVLEDVKLGVVKTGMLYSADIVKTVAEMLKRVDAPLVVDPVMVATTGSSLHQRGFVEAIISKILPQSALVTPNLLEASRLSGIEVRDERTAKSAAEEILELGPKAVLIKGGHLRGREAADYLLANRRWTRFSSPRMKVDVHGTGCTFASLIAGNLAKGKDLEEAIKISKGMIYKAILAMESVGKGVPCANPLAVLRIEAGKHVMLSELEDAGTTLEKLLGGALEPEEVAALEGRITRVGTAARKTGCARFGASKHVARIVLAASSHDPQARCAMNLKYSPENLVACRKAKLSVSTFDRSKEPKGVSSMTWGVHRAIEDFGRVPDAIFDLGGHGKEPMIRLLGRTPDDVISKLRKIISKKPSR
jgi:hydroxymethylpyrimidine/phosphomethylpyrimidine kinase